MKSRTTLVVSAIALAVSVFAPAAPAASVTVPAGDEYVLAAADNVAGDEIVLSAGSTLRLPSGAGDFTLRPYVRLVGSATLDTGDATSLVVAGGLYATNSSYALTVDGLGSFAFGRDNGGSWAYDIYAWPRLDISTINFTAGTPAAVTLTNDVAAFTLPSCTVDIARGARILSMGESKPFSRFMVNSTLTVSGWTALHGRTESVGNRGDITIQVEPDGAYYIMPRWVTGTGLEGTWALSGFNVTVTNSANYYWSENIVLNGAGAVFGVREYQKMLVATSVTGVGDVLVVRDGAMAGRCECCFFGTLDFQGKLSVGSNMDCIFDGGVTASSLAADATARIYGTTMTVGSLEGGSETHLAGLSRFALTGPSGASARLVVEAAGTEVDLADASEPLPAVCVYDGKRMALKGPEGVSLPVSAVWDPACTNWAAKVLLHFDASDASSIVRYPGDVCYTNGFPLVATWINQGSKGGSGYALRSLRGLNVDGSVRANDEHQETCPYLVPGGLNGKDYLCFGAYYGNKISDIYGKAGATGSGTVNEARRMQLYYGTNAAVASGDVKSGRQVEYAIMVFGSQQGGGRALLGTVGGVLDRGGTTLSSPVIGSALYPVNIDGAAVDATQGNLLNGDWQIVSIDMNATNFYAVGWNTDYNNAGGQNYAEVILFSSEPTEQERCACERYLAEKWGLSADYRGLTSPTFSTHACRTPVTVSGTAKFDGYYSGTLTVSAGATLDIGEHVAVPGEEAVVAANRVAWYDPSCPGSRGTPSGGSVPAYDMATLLSRDENGPVDTEDTYSFFGYYDTSIDRCAWTNVSARGCGTAMPWMEFRQPPGVSTTGGKGLRTRKGKSSGISRTNTNHDQLPATREAFLVLDTSLGGGNVLGVNASGLDWSSIAPGNRANNGTKAADPIWSNPSGVFASAVARLDDVVIDAATTGYNARPEVFSFATESSFRPGILGLYNKPDTSGAKQCEMIGEVIFYSTPLSDVARARLTAYLAFKWFGKVFDGYNDASHATVVGDGVVRLSSGTRGLPDLSGFNGTVSCACTNACFTLGTGSTVAGAVVSVGVVDMSKVQVVTLTAADGTFVLGEYVLASGSSVSVNPNVRYVLDGTLPPDMRMRFRQTSTTWTVSILRKPGIVVNFR